MNENFCHKRFQWEKIGPARRQQRLRTRTRAWVANMGEKNEEEILLAGGGSIAKKNRFQNSRIPPTSRYNNPNVFFILF